MAMKTSSKFDHITSKVLLHSGSPAVYQLKPKKENIGTLKKMTLGEKQTNKPNKTILLVGETGTGRSTLINTLVNYTMGVKWEDDVWFEIVEDEKRRQTESQTSDVIVYQIFGFEGKTLPYSLTIIDTPGYGNTRGTEYDDIVSQRLLDLFRSDDGVHEMNVVGLVLKASENQVSDRLSYIFDSVTSLFGKNMEEKIVALITHSDGVKPRNALKALEAANIKFAKDEKNQPVHFLFNNCQTEDRTEEPEALEYADKISTKGMKEFTGFLEKTASQKLKITVDVLNERVRLKACMQNLQERVELIEYRQKEIKQTREALREQEQEMKNNENFPVKVENYKDTEMITQPGVKATSCLVCEKTCHYPCRASSPRCCDVMNKDDCNVCPKCPVSKHRTQKWRYVNSTREVKKTPQDMKKKDEENEAECESKLSLLESLEQKMEELKTEKDQLLDESFKHVIKLEQIALNVDSLSMYVHLDFLIEQMKEKGDREKVQKLEEMKSRMDKDKGTRAGLWYGFGTLTAAGKAVGLMKK